MECTRLCERTATVVATWFGCGYFPVAPGTVGTIGAIPLYLALVWLGGAEAVLAAVVVIASLGVWAAGVVERRTGTKDPSVVVIDEVAGTLLALAVAPRTAEGVLIAVILFRFFDITKIWPANVAERLPRGWGVVADDIVAGVWSALCLLALRAALYGRPA